MPEEQPQEQNEQPQLGQPGQLEQPGQVKQPGQPEQAGQQERPARSAQPGQPDQAGQLEQPVQQEQPAQPTQPVQQEQSVQPPQAPVATQRKPASQTQQSVFGPNGRWLWFAGGVLFVLVGVIFTALFNMNKPAEQRNDAIKWSAYGMLVGVVINIVMLSTTGAFDVLSMQNATPTSSGSLF